MAILRFYPTGILREWYGNPTVYIVYWQYIVCAYLTERV